MDSRGSLDQHRFASSILILATYKHSINLEFKKEYIHIYADIEDALNTQVLIRMFKLQTSQLKKAKNTQHIIALQQCQRKKRIILSTL